jgi:hypothetical protein
MYSIDKNPLSTNAQGLGTLAPLTGISSPVGYGFGVLD